MCASGTSLCHHASANYDPRCLGSQGLRSWKYLDILVPYRRTSDDATGHVVAETGVPTFLRGGRVIRVSGSRSKQKENLEIQLCVRCGSRAWWHAMALRTWANSVSAWKAWAQAFQAFRSVWLKLKISVDDILTVSVTPWARIKRVSRYIEQVEEVGMISVHVLLAAYFMLYTCARSSMLLALAPLLP